MAVSRDGDRARGAARRRPVRLRRGRRLVAADPRGGLRVRVRAGARAPCTACRASTGGAASTATVYYGTRNTIVVCERHLPLGRRGHGGAARVRARRVPCARRAGAAVGRGGAGGAGGLRATRARGRLGPRELRLGRDLRVVASCEVSSGASARVRRPRGRARGGGPGELGGAREAGSRRRSPSVSAVRIASATDVGSDGVEVDRRVAGHLAQHRAAPSTRPARRAPSPRAPAGRSPRSASGWRRPPRPRRGTRAASGSTAPSRRTSSATPAAPRARGGRRCRCRGRRTRAAGRSSSAATPSISAARFLCGRSEATLSTSGRSPWPTSAGGGGSAGGGVTPLGTTSTFVIPSSAGEVGGGRVRDGDDPPRAPGGAGDEHVRAEPHRGRDRVGQLAPQHVVHGQHARRPAGQRPEVRDRSAGGRARAPPAAARNSSPIAHEPRATPEEPTRTTCAASSQKPVAGRLAVDERGELEVRPLGDEPAHELARVGLAPARLARARGTGGRGRPSRQQRRARSAPVRGLRDGQRPDLRDAAPRNGESRPAVSAAANSLAATVGGRLHRARAAAARPAARAGPRAWRAPSRPASRPAPPRGRTRARPPAAPAAAPPAAAAGYAPSTVSQRLRSSRNHFCVALRELVVVLDDRAARHARPPSPPAAAAATGRGPRRT